MNLRDDQGTTLIEFTLVAVAFVLLLVGILEFGLAFRERLTYNNAVATAARVGSRAGQAPDADWLVLQQLEDGLAASGVDDLRAVWVYRSNDDGTPVPGDVNYYEYTGAGACPWAPCPNPSDPGYTGVFNWDPADRSVDSANLDRLGVRVYFNHVWITDLLPASDAVCSGAGGTSVGTCWNETGVFRMEPQEFS